MRIAAIVVLYKPDIEAFIRNIRQYVDAVEKVLIWRNSSEGIIFPKDLSEKVILCGTGENQYIAKALNFAVEWCCNNGYDYLLTMDQDSSWLDFKGFIENIQMLPKDDVAIFAPNMNDTSDSSNDHYPVESVITSGSLCNVDIAKRLGGFREDYEIYWVDSEYCHWANLNGYKIEMMSRFVLKHRLGNPIRTKFGFNASNYSPTVYYFLFRNMLWMKREYHINPSLKCVLYTSFYHIRGILFGEQDKLLKLGKIVKAYYNGLFRPIKRRNI